MVGSPPSHGGAIFSLGASNGAGDAAVAQEAEEDVDDEGPEISRNLGASDENAPDDHEEKRVERPSNVPKPIKRKKIKKANNCI